MKSSKGERMWVHTQIVFLKVMYSSYLIYLLFLLGFAIIGPLFIVMFDLGDWGRMWKDLKGYLGHVGEALTRQGYFENQYRVRGEIEDVKKYL